MLIIKNQFMCYRNKDCVWTIRKKENNFTNSVLFPRIMHYSKVSYKRKKITLTLKNLAQYSSQIQHVYLSSDQHLPAIVFIHGLSYSIPKYQFYSLSSLFFFLKPQGSLFKLLILLHGLQFPIYSYWLIYICTLLDFLTSITQGHCGVHNIS